MTEEKIDLKYLWKSIFTGHCGGKKDVLNETADERMDGM